MAEHMNQEILEAVARLRAAGFGELRVVVHDHEVLELHETVKRRKAATKKS